jgi:hypothetical protein
LPFLLVFEADRDDLMPVTADRSSSAESPSVSPTIGHSAFATSAETQFQTQQPSSRPSLNLKVIAVVAVTALASHYPQVRDKSGMKAGVERDRERLRILTKEQQTRERQRHEQQSS